MYKLCPKGFKGEPSESIIRLSDGACIPMSEDNTDYQAFKTAVLEQELNTLIDNGDSFNMSSNESILEDAEGNVMTIDQAKEYVRNLP